MSPSRPQVRLHPHVRINFRVFTVLVLISLPLLILGSIVVFGIAQAQSRQTYGAHLEQLAERTAAAVDSFVLRRILDVSELARVPEVREVAASASRRPFRLDAVLKLDREWQRQPSPPAAVTILDNTASRFFRDVAQNDTIYSELLLTDAQGRLVAASNVTSDYFQADEEWWRNAFNHGGPHISDARWDDSAGTYAIEIAVPVFAPDSDTIAGVLKAVTNSREMLAAVSGVQFGETGEAALVRKTGTIVYDRGPVQPDRPFFAAPLVREALGISLPIPRDLAQQADRATDPEFRAYFSAQLPEGGKAMVAIAPTQLGISYPELPWIVAVYQSEAELFAPVRSQIWNFLWVLTLVVVALLVFALWFSMQLAAFPLDVDMQLVKHARIHRVDEDNAEGGEEEENEDEPERDAALAHAPGTSAVTR
jgi:cache domain-containing protein